MTLKIKGRIANNKSLTRGLIERLIDGFVEGGLGMTRCMKMVMAVYQAL